LDDPLLYEDDLVPEEELLYEPDEDDLLSTLLLEGTE